MVKKNSAILKIAAILILVIIVLKLCQVFLWPFVVSILLLFIVEPFVSLFKSRGFSRKASVIISFIIVITLACLMAFFLSNYVYTQVIIFFHNLPDIIDSLPENIKILNGASSDYKELTLTFERLLMSYRGKIIETIISTVNGFLYIIIILMTSIFLSFDLDNTVIIAKRILPVDAFRIMERVVNKINKILTVEVKLVLITAFETVAGLYLLGAGNALTIGLICGILDILPVVGPSLIFLPWIVYELLLKKIAFGVGLMLLFVLIQVIREILEVKLVGANLRLHPVTTIFSLYTGILVFGIWGVAFGPFIVILAKELYFKYYEGRFRIYK